MLHMTRERLGVFGDAVIAIILTVMALELPINMINGVLDFGTLFRAIGVYAVSFCFIASLWIQHVSVFSDSGKVSNLIVMMDLVFIFLLSLMPTFTKAMFQDVSRITLLAYGVLYMVINVLFYQIRVQMIHFREQEMGYCNRMMRAFSHVFKRNGLILFGANLIALVTMVWSPTISLMLLIALTVGTFLLNMRERKEFDDVFMLPAESQNRFFNMSAEDQKKFRQIMQTYLDANTANVSPEVHAHSWEALKKRMGEEFQLSEAEAQLWSEYGSNIMRMAREQTA